MVLCEVTIAWYVVRASFVVSIWADLEHHGKSMHLLKTVNIDEYSTLSETKVARNRKRVESWKTSFRCLHSWCFLRWNSFRVSGKHFELHFFHVRFHDSQILSMELVVVSAQVVFSAGFLKRHLSWSQFCGVLRLAIFVRCLKTHQVNL